MKRRKRSYVFKARGEKVAETRRRIAQATMELHEEVGPRGTTISAIAERAGVERLTVYRHFPDEDTLFAACSGRFVELNPPPEPSVWRSVRNPTERTRHLLGALYGYFTRTQAMLVKLERDAADIPALARVMKPFADYLAAAGDELAEIWQSDDVSVRAVARHCTRFGTWRSLETEGVSDAVKVRLATLWLERLSREP